MRVPAAEIGSEIDFWLKQIVLGLDLDRSALGEIDPKTGKLTVAHQWARAGLTKLPKNMELARRAPWFDQSLMLGKTLVFSKVEQLLAEFEGDLRTFRRYVPKSNVTIPLRIGGEIVGAVGFATLRKERSWPPRVIRRLQLVGEIFGNALERKRQAAENAMLRHELMHVSRAAAVAELSASLTHQLSQPIAAILSNAEAIQSLLESERPDLEEIKAAVSDIVQDDLRVSEIIKGLRAFFRNGQLSKVPLDLADVAGEVVRMVRSDALIRKVSLAFDAPAPVPPVAGDRVHLQQAFINLILNAFDAVSESDGPREVTARVVADTDRVGMIVRDSGRGLESAAMARMFEPFFTTKASGMGMGLTIAKSIVEAHGGRLLASPNPDRGATFEISLPALNQRNELTGGNLHHDGEGDNRISRR